ncbi:hypothetical protein TUM4438_10780 [Shewanella sairae]|uniref:Single-stranded DNA-binding protein n=1 Tax=Shewanella sairae TaxID=190310 RepID=A0ABQ4P657_9GAMM|nr:single-stranded DNA-binding protein [Shewanella sairae]MCL1130511.1 single-stranded DNA-binding protein [Shewanella sairae]GIU42965.1 hypothetical protein TUM4438_10780 [Shewanella sairae]
MAKSSFTFTGNIGQQPKLTFQPANERSNGQQRPLLSFNVKYDRLVKSNEPGKNYEDKGGFWVRVDYWRNNAELLNKLLCKGMQVQITGELRMDSWPDAENPGQTLTGMAITADNIAIMPTRLQSITMAPRQGGQAQQHQSSQQSGQQYQPQQQNAQSAPADEFDNWDEDFPC